jgi:hypothetical protein
MLDSGSSGTEDLMATTDSMRVGDSERESVAAELREHYAQGRLTLEDFNQRLDAALAAKTRGDLDRLISDLPHVNPPGAPLPVSAAGPYYRGHRGHDHRNYRGRRGPRMAGLAFLISALASVLIVFDLMAGFRFPMPGKLGILLAVFAVIRMLLRRIFGGWRRFPRRW